MRNISLFLFTLSAAACRTECSEDTGPSNQEILDAIEGLDGTDVDPLDEDTGVSEDFDCSFSYGPVQSLGNELELEKVSDIGPVTINNAEMMIVRISSLNPICKPVAITDIQVDFHWTGTAPEWSSVSAIDPHNGAILMWGEVGLDENAQHVAFMDGAVVIGAGKSVLLAINVVHDPVENESLSISVGSFLAVYDDSGYVFWHPDVIQSDWVHFN